MAFLRSVIKCSVAKKFRLSIHNVSNILSTRNSLPSIKNHIQSRCRSTAAANVDLVDVGDKPRRDPLDTSFNDPEAAFKSKTTWEILRAYVVYTLCSSSYLVEHNMELMKITKAILGEKLFIQVMKSSFYGHFVAGEDQHKIVPTLERLRSFGVKPILDYSVEEDLSQEEAEKREVESSVSEIKSPEAASEAARPEASSVGGEMPQYNVAKTFADRRYKVQSARTYFYLNEATCERNVETFQECLHAVQEQEQLTRYYFLKNHPLVGKEAKFQPAVILPALGTQK